MSIAASVIVAFSIALSISCIAAWGRRKGWEKERVVHLPFYLALVGMICGGILCIPTVLCALDKNWTFLFFGAAVLGCDCMMIAYLNCVIRYDSKGFFARNFFGIKRECSYANVEGIRFSRKHKTVVSSKPAGWDRRVYFQGHWILIDEISRGGEDFIKALNQGYQKATGQLVPESTSIKRKWDPMNGHLDYPWEYFILWAVMGLFFVALPVLIFVAMTIETDPADVVIHHVQFCSYKEADDGSLMLYADGEEKPFKIHFYWYYDDKLPSPEALCGGWYSVGVEGNNRYVKSLTREDGTQYITLETEHQVRREGLKNSFWFLCIVAPLGVYFCYLAIAVARNPERYSDRVRRLFYQDGVLH